MTNDSIFGVEFFVPRERNERSPVILLRFYVSRSLRGKGYGELILKDREQDFKSQGYKRIDIPNPRPGKATFFYEKKGNYKRRLLEYRNSCRSSDHYLSKWIGEGLEPVELQAQTEAGKDASFVAMLQEATNVLDQYRQEAKDLAEYGGEEDDGCSSVVEEGLLEQQEHQPPVDFRERQEGDGLSSSHHGQTAQDSCSLTEDDKRTRNPEPSMPAMPSASNEDSSTNWEYDSKSDTSCSSGGLSAVCHDEDGPEAATEKDSAGIVRAAGTTPVNKLSALVVASHALGAAGGDTANKATVTEWDESTVVLDRTMDGEMHVLMGDCDACFRVSTFHTENRQPLALPYTRIVTDSPIDLDLRIETNLKGYQFEGLAVRTSAMDPWEFVYQGCWLTINKTCKKGGSLPSWSSAPRLLLGGYYRYVRLYRSMYVSIYVR